MIQEMQLNFHFAWCTFSQLAKKSQYQNITEKQNFFAITVKNNFNMHVPLLFE